MRNTSLWSLGRFLALALLITSSALFISCPSPFSEEPVDGGGSESTDDGGGDDGGGDPVDPFEGFSWKYLGSLGTSTDDVFDTRPLMIRMDSSDNPVVAFRDTGNENKLTVKTYNGTSWDLIGSAGFSTDVVRWIAMDIDSSGYPYVAYRDSDKMGNGTIQYWNGSAWNVLGNPGETAPGTFDYGVMTLDASDNPTVLYRNSENQYSETSARQWNGASWAYQGGRTMAGQPLRISHTFWKRDGTNPVSLAAVETPGEPSGVMVNFLVYNTSTSQWEDINVGADTALVSQDSTTFSAIASSGNKLYVAYNDYDSGKLTVKEWDPNYPNSMPPDGNWNLVSNSISTGAAEDIALITDNSGLPIVAYKDVANSNKVTVKKYIENDWVTLGSEGISFGASDWISLAVDSNNITYVAYRNTDDNNAVAVMRFTDSAGTTTLDTPSTPDTPTAAGGKGSLDVSWTAVENASAYELHYSTGTDSSAATKIDNITGLSHTISGLDNNTTYNLWIKAKNVTGSSGFSPMGNGTTLNLTPAEPAAPSVTPGNEELSLSWSAVDGATSYEVYYHTSNASGSATKETTEPTGTTHTITELTGGTPYYVWIKAKNTIGTSGFSPYGTGTPTVTPKTWQYLGAEGFISSGPEYPQLVVDHTDGDVFFAVAREADNDRITVKKWNDGTSAWDDFGNSAFGVLSHGFTMEMRGDDDPVIVQRSPEYGWGTGVWECNGGTWSEIGSAPISTTSSPGQYKQALTFDSSNNPIVAYYEPDSGVSVRKYDGANWSTSLGGDNFFTAGHNEYYSFETLSNGNLVLAVTEIHETQGWPYTHAPRIKEWDGSSWSDLPLPDTARGNGFNTYQGNHRIAVDDDDNIYVAYSHVDDGLVVYKYNGASWTRLGSAGTGSIAEDDSYSWALSFDSNNNPVIAYDDRAYGRKAFVKKWNGSDWELIGSNLSDGMVIYIFVDVDRTDDSIYISYRDYYENTVSVMAYK